jgi:hypothetical protein
VPTPGILPRITTSLTRNILPVADRILSKKRAGNLVEWLFRRELRDHGRGIHLNNVYSTRNYQLRDEKSTEGMGFHRELPAHRQGINPRKGIPGELPAHENVRQVL